MSTSIPESNSSLTTPLRVWHVVGPMNHGGTEVMIMEILRHKAQGTQMDFLVHQTRDHVAGTADFDDEIKARGARLLPITTPVQSGLRGYFRTFRELVAKEGAPDVIHTHLNARSGLVVFAARRCGIKRIIVHAHAALTFRGSLAYRMLANVELAVSKVIFGLMATDMWGCSAEAIMSQFPRWSLRTQSRVVINNAINVEEYVAVSPEAVEVARAALSGGRPGLLIGTVGRIVRHKNMAPLVDVLSALRQRGVDATLAIVGREDDTAYCAEIRVRARHLNLTDAVRFVGSRNDIPAVMAALDVFVSPALREGFGLVGLEAQAAGTPAVLSKGFPKMIDLELGIVRVPEGDDCDLWADAVMSASTCKRPPPELVARVVTERGFSATENTRRIERAWRDPSFLPGAKA